MTGHARRADTGAPVRGAILVMAKTPRPAGSKTRLSPPLTPDEACAVAWACLLDTLDVVAQANVDDRVLVLNGEAGDWVPPGMRVVPQCIGGLGDRLAAALTSATGPAIAIAMDTPQVSPETLEKALAHLLEVDAVVGPALDGGYWLIGLRPTIDPRAVFAGIPMSTTGTCAAQLQRLDALGLRVRTMSTLRDVDEHADLLDVAAEAPHSRLARVAATLPSAGPDQHSRPARVPNSHGHRGPSDSRRQ